MQGFVRSGVIENLDPGDLELVYVRSLANDRPASPATELAPRGATGERASFEAGLAREIRALEERLLDPTHRADPRAVSALLEDEFVELGASGRRWTKSTFLAALTADGASSGRLADFSLRLLASDVALATYRIQVSTNAPGPAGARGSLRSSIWRRAPGGAWRLLFHQGTPTGAHP
jgi:ribonuclease HI